MSGYSGNDMEDTKIDYSAYDLLDEFTVGHIAVGYTIKADGTCDGSKVALLKAAIGQAIQNSELVSSLNDDNDLYFEYLSPDGPRHSIDWQSSWGTSIRIKRGHLIAWFESKGQHPPFLFKQSRTHGDQTNSEGPISESKRDNGTCQTNAPEHLTVIVDEENELVFVATKGSSKRKRYRRNDIVGKGTVTWLLLVDFAKCGGSLEGNNKPDVEQRNTPGNRINLGNKLMEVLRLDKSPIIERRSGVMRFGSIGVAADGRSTDAMDRVGTEFLDRHGEHLPPY